MTIIQRVQSMLEERGIKASVLCEYARIDQGTYSAWKKRGTNPGAEYISAIADFFDVPERYILTGEAPKAVYDFQPQLSKSEERLLSYWRALNDLGQARLLVDANAMTHAEEYTD